MERYCFQYHSSTLASLTGTKEQQITPRPWWKFNFTNLELRVALSDGVKRINDVNLHTGLNIILDVKAGSEDSARNISKDATETILNLISFSTMTYCNPASLVSIMKVHDKEAHPFQSYVYPFETEEIIGALSIIDQPLFRTIFEAYGKSSHQNRIMRALEWLRKGVGEEMVANEFISYWVGLEVIKHILSPMKTNIADEWKDVKSIFTDNLHFQGFSRIKQAGRNGLLHGFRELDDAFMKEIKGYIEPVRKTLIYCTGRVLGLTDDVTLKVPGRLLRET